VIEIADPSLIVAVTGVVGMVTGRWVSVRGQREQRRQQSIEDAKQTTMSRIAETQQALNTYETLTHTLTAEAGRVATAAEQLRGELNTERSKYLLDTEAWRVIEVRCRAQSSTLVAALLVLQTSLSDAGAQLRVQNVRDQITEHPHEPTATGGTP
jgi:hypothetical protein